MEDCCSIPQRDCGRISRPSLLSTMIKARDSALTLNSKNYRESRGCSSRVNFIVSGAYAGAFSDLPPSSEAAIVSFSC